MFTVDSNLYFFPFCIAHSGWLAQGLQRADSLICGTFCVFIATSFWAITLILFAIWFVYLSLCTVIWLSRWLGKIVYWLINVVINAITNGIWVVRIILVWISGCVYRLVVVIMRLLYHRWPDLHITLRMLSAWSIHEFGEPFVCTFCVYLGVLTTSFLPSAMLLHTSPAAFLGVTISPLVAFAIAARVFDTRAFRRWRSSRAQLGVRVLRAYSDGLIWVRWLRRHEQIAV
jgi:hypothetical protein